MVGPTEDQGSLEPWVQDTGSSACPRMNEDDDKVLSSEKTGMDGSQDSYNSQLNEFVFTGDKRKGSHVRKTITSKK